MTQTTFFRLLKTPIDDKGNALAAQIAALNTGPPLPQAGEGPGVREETFTLAPTDFSLIPGSPFAYWVSDSIRQLFKALPNVQSPGRRVCFGLSTKDDFRFLRLSWEVKPQDITQCWSPFAKGGAFSPYYRHSENDLDRLA